MNITFQPVGIVHSCYKEKFGIPRQPGLVPDAPARIELLEPCRSPMVVRGLARFSHIWVVFVFHKCLEAGWKPTVRPPRCGGNRRAGVFATRSPFRPNPVGLSCVELTAIHQQGARVELAVRGGDLLDQTPVLDIKPYLPWADALPQADGGFAADAPARLAEVRFSPRAEKACEKREVADIPGLRKIITQMVSLDPRPAYAASGPDGKHYRFRVFDLDVEWTVCGDTVRVLDIRTIIDGGLQIQQGRLKRAETSGRDGG